MVVGTTQKELNFFNPLNFIDTIFFLSCVENESEILYVSQNSHSKSRFLYRPYIIFIFFVAYCDELDLCVKIADRGDVIPLPIHLYAVLLAHLNSSVNSIIYGLTNRQFRWSTSNYTSKPQNTNYRYKKFRMNTFLWSQILGVRSCPESFR